MKRLSATICMMVLALPALAADAQCEAIGVAFHGGPATAHGAYGMAFCAAREGRADEAFRYLSLAGDLGYHKLEHLRRDSDFDSVHADPRWQGAVERIAAVQQRYFTQVNPELYRMYVADQADRSARPIDWDQVVPRDEARRARVAELAAAGALRHADDYFHAALLFQHGDRPEHYRQAQSWAQRSVALGTTLPKVAWLACAAEDRWLHSLGRPQVWGTQFMPPKDGKGWTLEPFDRRARTDAERVANGVDTLADIERELARLVAGGTE